MKVLVKIFKQNINFLCSDLEKNIHCTDIELRLFS